MPPSVVTQLGLKPRFGGYLLTERLGQGGMAVVYKAKREGWSGFEKTVVVKAMLPALAQNKQFVDLFISEAKMTAQLSHPGIVQVHDFGVFQGTPYLVMEHLNGINLSQLMSTLGAEEKLMPVPLVLIVMTEMCHALGYAHDWRDSFGVRRQIIHSDVSPSNIMVCRDGSVKLLDFGVAKVIDAFDYDMSVTVKGKYPYMAPEQVNRLPIDRRVDVFASGIVLHELLTGRRLFAASTELETLKKVDAAKVPPPSKDNPAVTPELDAIVLKALSRDPADRYDSAEELASALESLGRVGNSRVGGARRRVAEYLASLFPDKWYVICQVCGKQAVAGFTCKECGTEAPVEKSQLTSESATHVVSPVVPEAIAADAPMNIAEAFPLKPVAPAPLVTTRRTRAAVAKVLPARNFLLAVSVFLVALAVGLRDRDLLGEIGLRRAPATPPASPSPPPPVAPSLDPPLALTRPAEPPSPLVVGTEPPLEFAPDEVQHTDVVTPPPAPEPVAPAPRVAAVKLDRARAAMPKKAVMPARPRAISVDARPAAPPPVEAPRPAPAATVTPSYVPKAAPVEAKPKGRVRDGKLLDLFGGE